MTSYKLKLKLFKDGLKEKICESCNLSEWLGEPIPLELHHIDGNNANNSLENLQVVCPNCHAKTDFYRGRGKTGARIKNVVPTETIVETIPKSKSIRDLLIKLGMASFGGNYDRVKRILIKNPDLKFMVLERPEKESRKSFCKERESLAKPDGSLTYTPTKIIWPCDDKLKEMVWQKSVLSIGKELGVSDKAIHNRCKYRNIPVPPVGYWRKLAVGKLEECEFIRNNLCGGQ